MIGAVRMFRAEKASQNGWLLRVFGRHISYLHKSEAVPGLGHLHIKAISRPYLYDVDMALIWFCAKLNTSVW